MAAPTKKSAWGFLSQAVAGVEARLDTILADNDDASSQSKDTKQPVSEASTPAPASPSKQTPAPSRTASTNRTNDRLQERLARAIAAKAAQKTDTPPPRTSLSTQGSPRPSLEAQSRPSTETLGRPSPTPKDAPSPRGSRELPRKSHDSTVQEVTPSESLTNGKHESPINTEEAGEPRASVDSATVTDSPKASETNEVDHAKVEEPKAAGPDKGLEDLKLQHQEEIHTYIERIDALEAKLQYLARETADSARKAALAAPAGSAEKKLAERDEKIAQLMEEGKKLASTEQTHRAILKRLRLKAAEDEKELANLKAAKEKSDRELDSLRRQARQAAELEKANEQLQKRLDQSQRELNSLRPENKSKDVIIAELRSQLQKATEQADALSLKVNNQAREQDIRRITELEDSVAALQVEKNLIADRAKAQANDLREKAERATERARALELELKAEVQMMESKLEGMRMRAEEASSGAVGDSQAKLLRQVETLQTQYSIASENWQGIEATLLARIANMEKERDEAVQRESDMRKKAREAAMRAKRNEEELEETRTRLPNMQEDAKTYQAQLDALTKRAEEAEASLAKATAEFEKQKQSWEAEKEEAKQASSARLLMPGERRSWLEDLPGAPFTKSDSRPESPARTFSTDFLGIQSLTSKTRNKISAPSSNGDAGAIATGPGSFGRRPSAQPLTRAAMQSAGIGSMSGAGLFSPSISSPFSPTSTGGTGGLEGLLSPSVSSSHQQQQHTHPLDREMTPAQQQQQREPLERQDTFDSVETSSSSPHQVMADMVSVSTVAAGPSVQLVERMSAAIRRLESEKVAAKEELARISKQRDEARAEIVALMREVEGGKTALKRVAEVEKEVAEVNERYETTLELLGEKSELVEELKADVEDLKAMYKDLVERTIK
ncbi:TATA element modulatory factor [Rhypophila decipiens]|uniref:TATA element modulatory factor n=1 Tax=Rhypophila decipiens TaxID=261697 RepID=A0AAN6Y417_9PEZI|nr:TATA element modulatory factor [Rhypophila decipiens]